MLEWIDLLMSCYYSYGYSICIIMNLLVSIIWIVVEADVIGLLAFLQRTTVPFKPMLVELITSVVIRGRSDSAEILVKVNLVELIVLSLGGGEESLEFLETVISFSIPCSLTTVMLHLMNCADAIHVI